jgi:hypothetical protein
MLGRANTTITFARQADGTIRMTRLGWDEAKVLLVGEALEVRLFEGHVAGFRQAKGGPVDYRALLIDDDPPHPTAILLHWIQILSGVLSTGRGPLTDESE